MNSENVKDVTIQLNINLSILKCENDPSPSELEIKVQKLLRTIALEFGCTVNELQNKARQLKTNLPRRVAIYLLRNHLQMGFWEISKVMGGCDQTSAMHAHHKVEEARNSNPTIENTIQKITASLSE